MLELAERDGMVIAEWTEWTEWADRVVEGLRRKWKMMIRSGRSGMMSGVRNGLSEILRDILYPKQSGQHATMERKV